MTDYSCVECRADIDIFFQTPVPPSPSFQQEEGLRLALEHMTAGSVLDHHHVACSACWNYYQKQKREHCGG